MPGPIWENTPFRLYKHFTTEGGCSTPFIVHWPAGIRRESAWIRDPAHVMDLLPTLCDLTGSPYPETFRGRPITAMEGLSLRPLFDGENLPERLIGLEHQGARGLRKGKWKLVWGKRQPQPPAWELYDLETDRCETTNLADRHPGLTKELAEEWLRWAQKVKVHPFFQTKE